LKLKKSLLELTGKNMCISKCDILVIGSGLNALGALRALGDSCDVLLASHNVKGPAWHSKYGSRWESKNTASDAFIEQLLDFGSKQKQKPLLLLTEELCVAKLAAKLEQLNEYFITDLIPTKNTEQLQSKSSFQALAESVGSPIPRSLTVNNLADLNKLDNISFPCIFKPLEQSIAYGKQFKKGYKVESAEQVIKLYHEIYPVNPGMIIQEWINGEDSDIYFYFCFISKNGDEVTSFSGRKIRSWPLKVGGTASCTSAPDYSDELREVTLSFCNKIGFTGLMGMEYKRDPIKNKFIMIEPTVGRTDLQHEIASLSGINVLQEIGEYFGKCTASKRAFRSVIWKDHYADKLARLESSDDFKPVSAASYNALFRVSDLKPSIITFTKRIKVKCKQLLRS